MIKNFSSVPPAEPRRAAVATSVVRCPISSGAPREDGHTHGALFSATVQRVASSLEGLRAALCGSLLVRRVEAAFGPALAVVALAMLAMLALGLGVSLVHVTPAPSQTADGGGE